MLETDDLPAGRQGHQYLTDIREIDMWDEVIKENFGDWKATSTIIGATFRALPAHG